MSDQKLDWVYSGVAGLVDPEEYLQGRRIDKTFEVAQQEKGADRGDFGQDEFRLPDEFSRGAAVARVSQLDNALKCREDPLMAIQQRSIEKRREILNNPLKLRKIRELLRESIAKERAERKKVRKAKRTRKKDKTNKGAGSAKKHKNKRKKESDLSSDESGTDSSSGSEESDHHSNYQKSRQHSKRKIDGASAPWDSSEKEEIDDRHKPMSKQFEEKARIRSSRRSDSSSRPEVVSSIHVKHERRSRSAERPSNRDDLIKKERHQLESSGRSQSRDRIGGIQEQIAIDSRREKLSEEHTRHRDEQRKMNRLKSRSPRDHRIESRLRSRSQSLKRYRSRSPRRGRSRSPRKDRSISRHRSRTPRKGRSRSTRRDKSISRHRSRTPRKGRSRSTHRNRSISRYRSRSPRRSRSRSPRKNRPISRHRSRTPRRCPTRSPRRDRSVSRHRSRSSSLSRANRSSATVLDQTNWARRPSTKMNEEELERKRLEMLHNGMWREQQRRKDISKYREEEEQEGDAKDGAKFIKPLLNSVAETDTVESMIRKKAFSNQRSYGAMERSFVRK